MTYYRRPPLWFYSGQEPPIVHPPPKSDPFDEAFLAGKTAADKERAAKGTDANKNRPELRALPPAIAVVCARHKPPLKPVGSETFAESIRAEVRHEIYAAVDSKAKKRLRSRMPEWPSAPVIKRAIGSFLRNPEKLRVIPKE